jgi:acetylornithine/succinyldiaminopimelate/putrescine aminotransferase
MEACGLMRVCAVRPNVPRDLEEAFERFEMPPFKIAAFFHEIVMMNYGARVLSRSFLRRAYDLCHQFDVPTVCDEIQSCLWAPGLLLFREYGLSPSFVVVGKGLSGGEYAASRVLFSATMDNLSQFGALVTNGQEELASLTYLIAMRWALANEEPIRALGTLYAERLNDLASRWPGLLGGVEGLLHMSALRFQEIAAARVFVDHMNARGYDLSLQAYKADCPPVVLTKLPLIAGAAMIEAVVEAMEAALAEAAMPGAV